MQYARSRHYVKAKKKKKKSLVKKLFVNFRATIRGQVKVGLRIRPVKLTFPSNLFALDRFSDVLYTFCGGNERVTKGAAAVRTA